MHPHIYTAIAQQTQTEKKPARCENKAANKMYIYIYRESLKKNHNSTKDGSD